MVHKFAEKTLGDVSAPLQENLYKMPLEALEELLLKVSDAAAFRQEWQKLTYH